jgi:hypothetical protein
VATDEQIYAVQYRKVRFRWFSSRDLERAALEKGKQWKVHGSLRGQEVGTNDVLEAAISEDERLRQRGDYVVSSHCCYVTGTLPLDRRHLYQPRGLGRTQQPSGYNERNPCQSICRKCLAGT